jgi:hypothetical protein
MAVGALDQEQESGGTGGQARCRGGLNEMTHRKRAQKLSLGSFLRPKSKEIVVCHDP